MPYKVVGLYRMYTLQISPFRALTEKKKRICIYKEQCKELYEDNFTPATKLSDTQKRKCDTTKDSFTYYTAFIFFRKMLLKVADVAHEEWNSLLKCLQKITRQKHSGLIQVSVEKGFG